MGKGFGAVIERALRGLHAAPREVRPIRILVVDDETPIRNFVTRVVGGAGFEVSTAAGPGQALAIASEQCFDLLLTDLMMPGMYGDELARRVREASPNLRVLYLTGFSDLLFAERVVLSEGDAFLDKPCTVNGLLEAVMLAASGRIDRSVSNV
jgi:CheY-like chemotaxis protein